MAKKKSSFNSNLNQSNPSNKEANQTKILKENIVKGLSSEISELSYEKSLEELDVIIKNLQDESILVEELQRNYLKATLYIEHCENLLNNIEQEVIEINTNKSDS